MTGIEVAAIAGTAITVGDIALVAGTAMTAVGAIQQGRQAKASAQYNAQVAENNATIARQNADARARRQEREARIRAGANRAARGKGGGRAEGSFLDVMEDNALEEERDRLMILHQGEIQAANQEAGAALMRYEGDQAAAAGYGKAASAVFMGASKLDLKPSTAGGGNYNYRSSVDPVATTKQYGSVSNYTANTSGQSMPGFVY